jgi:hypothetical protein
MRELGSIVRNWMRHSRIPRRTLLPARAPVESRCKQARNRGATRSLLLRGTGKLTGALKSPGPAFELLLLQSFSQPQSATFQASFYLGHSLLRRVGSYVVVRSQPCSLPGLDIFQQLQCPVCRRRPGFHAIVIEWLTLVSNEPTAWLVTVRGSKNTPPSNR